ncbi:MAG: response regulator [Gammaproteobacteria bacterium]|nr:response regulator [Gammaproteobacteria bacterium]
MVVRGSSRPMDSGPFGRSLASRLMLGAAALIAALAVALAHVLLAQQTQADLADRGAELGSLVERNAERLGSHIEAMRRDVLFLAGTPPVLGIVRAARNGGLDPREHLPATTWLSRLQEIFSVFTSARPDYYQIRFLGVADGGRELVRVEVRDGRPRVTPPEQLQRKADRDYFQGARRLKAGEVFLSEIDLNREHGAIQVPWVRTLRAATPVFGPDGALFGMVVINMDVGPIIDAITTGLAPGVRGYLMNDAGDYLAHPEADRSFGFASGQRYTWQQDMPGLRVPASAGESGPRQWQSVSAPAGLLHVAATRLEFDPRQPARHLLLAYALPDAHVQAQLAELRKTTIGMTSFVAVCVAGLVWLLLRWAFAPLRQLTALADRVGAGDYEVALPTAGLGEVPAFVRAFRKMIDEVRAREERITAAGAALQESESRLQKVVENLAEGVLAADLSGRILHFNRAALTLHGFTDPAGLARHLSEFSDTFELSSPGGTVLPTAAWPLARVLLGEDLRDLEVRIRRVKGDWQRLFSYSGGLVRDAGGQPLLAVLTIRDITERRQAEDRIQAQLSHLQLLDQLTRAIGERQDLQSIFQVVVRRLEDSLPLDLCCVGLHEPPANPLRLACIGPKNEPLARELMLSEQATIDVDDNGLGRCLQGQLVYEPDIGRVAYPLPRKLAQGGLGSLVLAPLRSESRTYGILLAARRAVDGFTSVDCEFLRQLGEHVALAAHQAQLYSALQQAYEDLRQSQQAVMQQERLRALGQMASGIAHDINNALSPVSLYTESLLETERNLSERARDYLQTIHGAVQNVAQTIGRMREFYRRSEEPLELARIDVSALTQQVIDLTRPRWSDMAQRRGVMIRLQAELAPDLPAIMGVESEIRDALTNLVFNAVDAMPEGGTLAVRTRLRQAPWGSAVAIEVADQGTGMDEKTRERCLEPFFTTKGEQGTGLGLPMVYGVVQRHGADLEIDSAAGAGTTMRLVFPAPAALPAAADHPAQARAVPAHLRLLLIDDDPLLLKSLGDALETDGHVIVTANGGQEGISVFHTALARGERFDAVITDLGMPYVDGRKVAAAIKDAAPATPVVLLTGWGQRLVAENDIPAHVARVLAKPPKLRELRDALADLCRPRTDPSA